MAGTIVTDRIESDASYASSITVASPLVVANTITMGSAAAISGGPLYISNNVGIGVTSLANSSPRRLLQVSNGTDGGIICLQNSTTESNNPRIFSEGTLDLGLAAAVTTGNVKIYTNNIARMTIDASGRTVKPNQPGFKVRGVTSQNIDVVGDATSVLSSALTLTTENGFNVGNHYNTGNGRFTAPVSGYYFFFANIRWETNAFVQNDYMRAFLSINGGTGSGGYYTGLAAICGSNEAWANYMMMQFSGIITLNANDYVELRGGMNGASGTIIMDGNESSFGGYLLG
jgi:hypothetical protein